MQVTGGQPENNIGAERADVQRGEPSRSPLTKHLRNRIVLGEEKRTADSATRSRGEENPKALWGLGTIHNERETVLVWVWANGKGSQRNATAGKGGGKEGLPKERKMSQKKRNANGPHANSGGRAGRKDRGASGLVRCRSGKEHKCCSRESARTSRTS